MAKQLIISQDGTTAYVITSNLSSILAFNIPGQTSSAYSLVGNSMPLSAALTADGTLLYVGANDGTVHVVSTVAGGDINRSSSHKVSARTQRDCHFPSPAIRIWLR